MEKKQFIEAGQVVNTHGIRGEVKIQPWSDTPDFLFDFDTIYLDGAPYTLLDARVHKSCLIASLEGITDVNTAMTLKGKTVTVNRDDVVLPEGRHFIVDLIGLEVRCVDNGVEVIGKLADVLDLPSNQVYVVKGKREYMIPAVDEFILETNVDEGYINVHLLEGM